LKPINGSDFISFQYISDIFLSTIILGVRQYKEKIYYYHLPYICGNIIVKITPELEKHKVEDTVTADKKHSNNDIQRPEEEGK
jgi:hypothetical protein